MEVDIYVTINNLYVYIPTLITVAKTQLLFNNSMKKTFTLTFDCWTTARKTFNRDAELQFDMISSSNRMNHPFFNSSSTIRS